MDQQQLSSREYATRYATSSPASINLLCLDILAGQNPAIMAALVAVRICREDKDQGMADEFIRNLLSHTEFGGETRHKVTTDVRHPYYDMCDQLYQLQAAVKGDRVMNKDDTLNGHLASIKAEIDNLTVLLNANYLWD